MRERVPGRLRGIHRRIGPLSVAPCRPGRDSSNMAGKEGERDLGGIWGDGS